MKFLSLLTLPILGLTVFGCSTGGSRGGGAAQPSAASPVTSGATTPAPAAPAAPTTSASGTSSPSNTSLAGLQVFPADNPWNTDISTYPVHPNSTNFIASIGAAKGLHPDFGTTYQGAPNGIPFVVVPLGQAMAPINFVSYPGESDPGPYPVPANAPIEGGPQGTGDRHVIVVDPARRMLYELFNARPDPVTGGWSAGSGAVFDLDSNALRPAGWTSADAAGLPVFPGLVRYEEVVGAGVIKHALRFTVARSQRGYVHPARHFASSSTDRNRPPMGLRLRLKASVDLSAFPAEAQVVLQALKTYGMIVADNGSDWFLSGAPDPRWDDSKLRTLKQIKGSDFEVVNTGPIVR